MRSFIACLFVGILLTSCVSYTPKQGEPSSLLRVVTFDGAANLEIVDTATCPQYTHLIYRPLSKDDMRPEKRLGVRGEADASAFTWHETYLPAGKKLILNLESTRPSERLGYQSQCSIGVLIQPKQDAHYEIQYRHSSGSCRLSLFEVSSDGRRVNLLVDPSTSPAKLSQSWASACKAGQWQ